MDTLFLVFMFLFFFFMGIYIEKLAFRMTQETFLPETSALRKVLSKPFVAGFIFALPCSFFFLREGVSFSFLITILLSMGLFLSALTDLYSGFIFDIIPILMGGICLFIRAIAGLSPFIDGITGAIAGMIIMLLIRLLSKGGLGSGDIKLMGGMGAGLGLHLSLYSIYIGILTGGLVAALLLLLRRAHKKQPIPFAPFLAFGGIIAIATFSFLERFFSISLPWPWNL